MLWASTASAKECGIRHGGFVFPYGWGCFYSGFFGVGTHLGLGSGYPGLKPPFTGFGHLGYYPGRYRLPLRIPPVIVYTLRPVSRINSGHREVSSGPIARGTLPDQTSPAQAVVGRGFQGPAPSLDEEAKNGAQFDTYIPLHCYRGECYSVNSLEALPSDYPLGIIIWEPKN